MEKYEARKQSRIVGDGLPEEMMDADHLQKRSGFQSKVGN